MLRRVFPILYLASFAVMTDISLVSPLYPTFAHSLGVGIDRIVWAGAAYQFASMSALLMGPMADRYGRRRLIVLGLVAFAVGALLTGMAQTFALFLAARAVMGLASSAYNPSSSGLLGDIVPYARRARIMGLYRSAMSIAGIVAVPAAMLLVEHTGVKVPFAFIAMLGVVMAGATAKTLRPVDTVDQDNDLGLLAHLGELLHSPRARLAGLFVVFWVFLPNLTLSFLSGWLTERFTASTAQIGMVFGLNSVAFLGGALLATVLADRVGKKQMAFWATALTVAAGIVLPLSPSVPVAIGCLLVFGVGLEGAWTAFVAVASELLPSARGTVMGFVAVCSNAAGMTVLLLGGVLWRLHGYPAVVGLAVGGGVLSLGALHFLSERPVAKSNRASFVRTPSLHR